jgi:hypothetical protein
MLKLSQGVHGVVLEARDDGVTDFIDKDGNISRMQDVTEILRENHFLQGEDKFQGFRIAPDFRKVASIPVAVVDIAAAQGLDILNNVDHLKYFLNHSDNRAFRTTLERV